MGEWTTQQAHNFDMLLQEENLPCTILQRDRDAKYVQTFDDVFTGEGRTVKRTPIKSPIDVQATTASEFHDAPGRQYFRSSRVGINEAWLLRALVHRSPVSCIA